jgi:hypothetical protein
MARAGFALLPLLLGCHSSYVVEPAMLPALARGEAIVTGSVLGGLALTAAVIGVAVAVSSSDGIDLGIGPCFSEC